MKITYGKIYLPHIHYTVYIRKFTCAPEESPNARAYTKTLDSNSCAIYIEQRDTAGDIAHELVHVLQRICVARDINFVLEQEHMAYIMHYLMGKITGYIYL